MRSSVVPSSRATGRRRGTFFGTTVIAQGFFDPAIVGFNQQPPPGAAPDPGSAGEKAAMPPMLQQLCAENLESAEGRLQHVESLRRRSRDRRELPREGVDDPA